MVWMWLEKTLSTYFVNSIRTIISLEQIFAQINQIFMKPQRNNLRLYHGPVDFKF